MRASGVERERRVVVDNTTAILAIASFIEDRDQSLETLGDIELRRGW